MPDYDPIEQSRRYAFGETPTHYGVWDKQAGTVLLEQFPLTDEGFEQAAARYDELKRKDRRDPRFILWYVMLGGVVLMVVGAILETVISQLFQFDLFLGTNISYALSYIGYNVTLGSLALLAGLVLIRRGSRARVGEPEPPSSPLAGSAVMWWALLIALGVWIVSSIATQLLFRIDIPFDEEPGTAERLAQAVESLAFRVWVAVLAIWWGRRLVGRSATEASPTAE